MSKTTTPNITISKLAQKQMKKAPEYIVTLALEWVEQVGLYGLNRVRLNPKWRDHGLKGKLKGIRSVYLNRQWRLLYTSSKDGIEITIEEVNPHDYKS